MGPHTVKLYESVLLVMVENQGRFAATLKHKISTYILKGKAKVYSYSYVQETLTYYISGFKETLIL